MSEQATPMLKEKSEIATLLTHSDIMKTETSEKTQIAKKSA